MRQFKPIIALPVMLLLFATACAKNDSNRDRGTLDRDIYTLPEKGGKYSEGFVPDQVTEESVSNVFRLNAMAMAETEIAPVAIPDLPSSKPIDWVPWHLQGIIASFGISADGIFGSLVGAGEAAVKGVWQRTDMPQKELKVADGKKADLVVTSASKPADVSRQLEPALRAALATGLVKKPDLLRARLMKMGEQFRVLSQALATTRFFRGWKVENYRLEVGFSAEGEVASVGSVGAAVRFRFDWEKSVAETSDSSSVTPALGQSMREFVQTMVEDIEASVEQTRGLSRSGYELEEVRVGLGITAGGEIGIADSEVSAMGSITFARDEGEQSQVQTSSENLTEFVSLVSSSVDADQMRYAAQVGTPFTLTRALNESIKSAAVSGSSNRILYRVNRHRFRKGLARAIQLGSFFAKMAGSARASKWQLEEIETEFEVSVGGTVGVATVSGDGAVILTFAKKNS
jgi:hypothetical protein